MKRFLLTFLIAALTFSRSVSAAAGEVAAAAAPQQITTGVFLARQSAGSERIKTYRSLEDLETIKTHLDPELYALLKDSARLLQSIRRKFDALSEADKMSIGAPLGDNVFLSEPAAPQRASLTQSLEKDEARIVMKYRTPEDGGVTSRKTVEFLFKRERGEWKLVNVLRESEVSNLKMQVRSDLKTSLRREVQDLKRVAQTK